MRPAAARSGSPCAAHPAAPPAQQPSQQDGSGCSLPPSPPFCIPGYTDRTFKRDSSQLTETSTRFSPVCLQAHCRWATRSTALKTSKTPRQSVVTLPSADSLALSSLGCTHHDYPGHACPLRHMHRVLSHVRADQPRSPAAEPADERRAHLPQQPAAEPAGGLQAPAVHLPAREPSGWRLPVPETGPALPREACTTAR